MFSWSKLHPGVKIFLGFCLAFGLIKGALAVFLPYHDDAETVRHSAGKAGLVQCFTQQAHAGLPEDSLRSTCMCAGDKFAASLTGEQIKPLQTHKQQFAPPFQLTPAMQPQLDTAIRQCTGSR
ncbi:hypothetical protein [Terriglobus sp.]|uniref:hypothetical protein n=1 Tax=Terriglobus sp. TaxID=1889013 RepID=UPI003AFF7931